MRAAGSGHARALRSISAEPAIRPAPIRPSLGASAAPLGGRRAQHEAASRAPSALARRLDKVAKRLLDVVVSLVLLVACLPILLAVGLAVLVDSPGPLFYACSRVGRGGRELRVLKFRKMRHGARGPALTTAGDERFTRIGPWLAATKLDELPQLWNVLRGSMSLVGPRPEDPGFVAVRREDYATILEAKPGITGLSQLAFARERDILDPRDAIGDYVERLLPQKIGMDTLYATRRTFALDLQILLWTVVATILGRDVAVDRETGRMTLRRAGARRGGRAAGAIERRRAA